MTGRKILKLTGISLVAIIALAILILWAFDFGALKPKIESAISDAINRELRINGELSLKVLPTPTLLIEDVTLANPDWGSQPQMLKVGKIYLKVKLIPLLSEEIVVKKLELDNVQLLVESSADEKGNWDFDLAGQEQAEPEEDAAPADQPFTFDIQSADIKKIQVIYRQPDADDLAFMLDSFAVSQNEDATTRVNGKGQFRDIPLSVSGQISDHHTDLQLHAGKVTLASKYDYPKDSVNFSSSLSTLSDLGGLLNIDELPDTALSLNGKVSLSDGNIILSNIVAGTKGIRIELNGKIDTGAGSVEVSAQASGDELSLFSPDLPALPFNVKSEIKVAGAVVDLKPYKIKIGENTIAGEAQIQSGDKPVIRLLAKSDLIDLSPFISDDTDETSQPEPGETKPEPASKYIFDKTPLPFDTLQTVNLEADVNITRLIVPGTEFKNMVVAAQAKSGNITLSNTFEGKFSGKYDNNLALKTSGQKADITVDTKVRDLKIALLSGDTVPEDQIPVTNMNIDLHSNGSSPRAIASNLDGKVVINQSDGKVSNELIEKFTGDILSQLFNAINPFAEKEEFTHWECSLFAIDFKSGEGDIKGFLMQSEQLMVVGGGGINLDQETLDIEFNTKPRKGVGVSADMFVTPFVKLTGTLANPSVGLNNKGVLLSGGAAVLTGGMSFLYTGVMDRVTAEAGRCEEAVAALENKQSGKKGD